MFLEWDANPEITSIAGGCHLANQIQQGDFQGGSLARLGGTFRGYLPPDCVVRGNTFWSHSAGDPVFLRRGAAIPRTERVLIV